MCHLKYVENEKYKMKLNDDGNMTITKEEEKGV
jgi:hypothetical protein